MRRLLLATMALLHAHAAEATTYYVNQATGLATNSGLSATQALSDIQPTVYKTKPGDTVLVYNGTYNPWFINHSGSAGHYITFKAAPGQKPVVLKNATAFNGITVRDGESYLAIQGFTVVGNAQSVTLTQANVSDTSNYTTNGSCIGVPKTAHHIDIANNILSFCPGSGIIFWGDYGTIRNNTIYSNAYWSRLAESGMVIVGSNIPGLAPGTIQVYGNFVYSNEHLSCNNGTGGPGQPACIVTDGQGIIVDSNGNPASPTGCGVGTNYQGTINIYNNISWNNGGWGLVIHCSQNVNMYNNTTWANGATTAMQPPYVSSSGGELGFNHSNNIKIENNILVGTSSNGLMWGTSNTNFTFNYNMYYSTVGILYFGNGAYGYTPIGPNDTFQVWPPVAGALPPPAYFMLTAATPPGDPSLVPPTDFANRPRVAGSVDRGAYRRP